MAGKSPTSALSRIDRETGIVLTGIGLSLLSLVLPWFAYVDVYGDGRSFGVSPDLFVAGLPLLAIAFQIGGVVQKSPFVVLLAGISNVAFFLFYLAFSWSVVPSPLPSGWNRWTVITWRPDGPAIGLLAGLTGSVLATSGAMIWWRREGPSSGARRAAQT